MERALTLFLDGQNRFNFDKKPCCLQAICLQNYCKYNLFAKLLHIVANWRQT